MRIVITGNQGYIGPMVVKHLKKTLSDLHITGVDTGYFKSGWTGSQASPECLVDKQLFADVRDIDADVLNGADALIQLAAISNDPMGNAYEQVTHDINCVAATRLTKVAKSAGVRSTIIASSCSIYGQGDDSARTENSVTDPLTAYAKSKLNLEHAVQGMASEDFQVTSLRFPTACGISNNLRLDLVLNDFVASAMVNGRIEILSDGSPWRPLIDTQDMARSIEWALTRSSPNEAPFLAINAGCNESNYQIWQLAELVKDFAPNVEIATNPKASPDKRSYKVDFSRYAELAPNHQPKISLSQSIGSIWESLNKVRFADKNFRSSDKMRLNVLKAYRTSGRLDSDLRWVH